MGVIDVQYRNKRGLPKLVNKLCYFDKRTCLVGRDSKKMVGGGFKVGEKVRVSVNLYAGIVMWIVNYEVRHMVHFDVLKQKKISFVPYIFLNEIDDSVSIVF